MTAAVLSVSATDAACVTGIARALLAAGPGATVAVRPGVYRESLVFTRDVILVAEMGPGSVVIEVPPGSALLVADGDIRLRDLEIRGGDERLPMVQVAGGRLRMDNCDLRATAAAALQLRGGRTRVRGGRIGNPAGAGVVVEAGIAELTGAVLATIGGPGLMVSGGAMPILRGCTLTDIDGVGVLAAGTGAALIDHCRIGPVSGIAVVARAASRLRMVGTLVEGGQVGLHVADQARPSIEGCQFRDTRGHAVVTVDRAAVSLVECHIENPAGHGLYASGRSAPEFQRCVVRGSGAAGAVVDENARPTFIDGEMSGCRDAGVLLRGESMARLEGVRVHGSAIGVSIEELAAPRLVGLDISDVTWGLHATAGAGQCEDGRVSGARQAGLRLAGTSSAQVRGVHLTECRVGIEILGDACPTVTTVEVDGARDAGILVRDAAHPELSRIRVHRTAGPGLVLGPGTQATVVDAELVGNRGAGILIETDLAVSIEGGMVGGNGGEAVETATPTSRLRMSGIETRPNNVPVTNVPVTNVPVTNVPVTRPVPVIPPEAVIRPEPALLDGWPRQPNVPGAVRST